MLSVMTESRKTLSNSPRVFPQDLMVVHPGMIAPLFPLLENYFYSQMCLIAENKYDKMVIDDNARPSIKGGVFVEVAGENLVLVTLRAV